MSPFSWLSLRDIWHNFDSSLEDEDDLGGSTFIIRSANNDLL